jgi:hypothetical protein
MFNVVIFLSLTEITPNLSIPAYYKKWHKFKYNFIMTLTDEIIR